jgi:hypothetical protein
MMIGSEPFARDGRGEQGAVETGAHLMGNVASLVALVDRIGRQACLRSWRARHTGYRISGIIWHMDNAKTRLAGYGRLR